METGPVAALTIQAAVEGVVDFSQADPYDKHWYMYRQLVLAGLKKKKEIELSQLDAMTRWRWLVLHKLYGDNLSEETATSLTRPQKLAFEALYFPEDDAEEKALKTRVVSDMQAWENQFGSLDDPEVQKKLASWVENMERLMEETNQAVAQDATLTKGPPSRVRHPLADRLPVHR